MDMRIILAAVLIIVMGSICSVLATPDEPVARSVAKAFADAQAVTTENKNPFAIVWTTTTIYDNSLINPTAISESAGDALASLDSTSFANSFSSAFAFSKGLNLAETKTWTTESATVSDYSASAVATSHAEGSAS